jgi:lysophospholipase L1-like esterase
MSRGQPEPFRSILVWVAMTLAMLLLAPRAGAQSTVKIMPLGDSITHGAGATASYRYPLWFQLSSNGTLVSYVGSMNSTTGTPLNWAYPNYFSANFNRLHEGHSGYKTGQILNDGLGFTLQASAALHRPDVVLLHIGTNDIGNAPLGDPTPTIDQAAANVGLIIDTLRAPSANPNVKVLLARVVPLLPAASGYGARSGLISEYNDRLSALAAAKSTAQSPVIIVDQFNGFSPSGQHFDGIHPNLYGEWLMADRFQIALQAVLNPQSPPFSPPIRVANPSFEVIVISGAADMISRGQSNNGWTMPSPAGSVPISRGVWVPYSGFYNGTGAIGTFGRPQGAEGSQVAYSACLQTGATTFIEQTIGATLAPLRRYTLRVAIGKRFEPNAFNSRYGGYRIELRALNPDGTSDLLKSDSNTITPDPGTFKDATLIVEAEDIPTQHLGKSIVIRFSQNSTTANTATDFDNVRLEATPCIADLTGDGLVNTADLTKFLARFGNTCP